jgi:hypothetical protein
MGIAFDDTRWEELLENVRKWWAGELGRPLIPARLYGRDPGRAEPAAPLLSQANCGDFDTPVSEVIDRIDYELSQQVFLGDGFPFFSMDCFGPGVLAAFLGGVLDNSSGRVWFYPPEELPITDIQFQYDPENPWARRVKDVHRAAVERWEGLVVVGMTDIGGIPDVLSTFRPSEKLLLDLYDHPDEVIRLVWEAHEAWHAFYDEVNTILQPVARAYSDWAGIPSEVPTYMLQCDFAYMIGPSMFDEFVKPELTKTCERLPHSFYHMDGVGQLPHLDSILSIGELDGVQWVPGSGKPDWDQWPEVYRRICDAGKLAQIYGNFDTLDKVVEQVGNNGRQVEICLTCPGGLEKEAEVRKRLSRYGAA